MHRCNETITLEVSAIKGKDALHGVDVHDGNEPRVIDCLGLGNRARGVSMQHRSPARRAAELETPQCWRSPATLPHARSRVRSGRRAASQRSKTPRYSEDKRKRSLLAVAISTRPEWLCSRGDDWVGALRSRIFVSTRTRISTDGLHTWLHG